MAVPREVVVRDLNEFLDLVADIGAQSTTGRLWFRGVSDHEHSLVPGLYRGADDAGALLAKEEDMRAQFESRSMPLLSGAPPGEWGSLFIMQHYGIPTRLLDWSENAFLGLYFALSVAAAKGFARDAAIWLLDPAAWNSAILPAMDPPGAALHAENSALNNFKPGREMNNMSPDVVAMFARYNNPRITAQRGVFTVFGREKTAMEQIFDTKGFASAVLTCARLARGDLASMNDQLRVLGFRESMIYPDLAGLATEIAIDEGFRA